MRRPNREAVWGVPAGDDMPRDSLPRDTTDLDDCGRSGQSGAESEVLRDTSTADDPPTVVAMVAGVVVDQRAA
eukprot:gene23455-2066_t